MDKMFKLYNKIKENKNIWVDSMRKFRQIEDFEYESQLEDDEDDEYELDGEQNEVRIKEGM